MDTLLDLLLVLAVGRERRERRERGFSLWGEKGWELRVEIRDEMGRGKKSKEKKGLVLGIGMGMV